MEHDMFVRSRMQRPSHLKLIRGQLVEHVCFCFSSCLFLLLFLFFLVFFFRKRGRTWLAVGFSHKPSLSSNPIGIRKERWAPIPCTWRPSEGAWRSWRLGCPFLPRKGDTTRRNWGCGILIFIYGCGSKKRYQTGTLVSGNMGQNLRNPSCLSG